MARWRGDDPEEELLEEEEEELGGEWELDPNDPTHPDYDLSESAGYGSWEPAPKPLLLRRGVVLLLTLLVIIGLMIPILARLS
jgi:hypothetical protein